MLPGVREVHDEAAALEVGDAGLALVDRLPDRPRRARAVRERVLVRVRDADAQRLLLDDLRRAQEASAASPDSGSPNGSSVWAASEHGSQTHAATASARFMGTSAGGSSRVYAVWSRSGNSVHERDASGQASRKPQKQRRKLWHASCFTVLVGPAASALPLPQTGGRGSPTLPFDELKSRRTRRGLVPPRRAWCTPASCETGRSCGARRAGARGARSGTRGRPGPPSAHRAGGHGARGNAGLRDGPRGDRLRAELPDGSRAQPLGRPAAAARLLARGQRRAGPRVGGPRRRVERGRPRGAGLRLGRRQPAREVAHRRGAARPADARRALRRRAAGDRVRGRAVPPARPRPEHAAGVRRGAREPAARPPEARR